MDRNRHTELPQHSPTDARTIARTGHAFLLLSVETDVLLKEVFASRIEESLDLVDTTTVCKAFEYWAGSWNGPLMASPGRQILDM